MPQFEAGRQGGSGTLEGGGPINDWIRRFLKEALAERNFSAHTIRAYGLDLAEFAAYCGEAGVGEPERLERRHVRAYLAKLGGRRLERVSLLRKISSLRSFCRWLRVVEVLRRDPFLNVALPKRLRRLPRFLSESEMLELLAASPSTRSPWRERDRAILELLYSCGLRRAELAGLEVGNVDFIGGTIRVFGKGSKERIVPAGGRALEVLREYLDARKGVPGPASPLFMNARGGRLSEQGVALVVRRWAKGVGFLKPVTPHAFRHSFATHLLDHGCDLRSVQEMLGHRSLSSTQVYTHTSLERLKAVYEGAHPRSAGSERAR